MGKTALLIRYNDNRFQTDYKATLGFDIFIKKFSKKGTKYSLAIWDIAGQEKLESLRTSYLEGAHAAILIFDVTNRDSFKNINNWLNDLIKVAGKIPFILVGNKIDLVEEIKVTSDEGEKLATQIKAINFYETSAKTGQNVNEIFEEISNAVHNKFSN